MSERYLRRGADGYERHGREDAVALEIAGTLYSGWESVQVSRSMDQAAQSFVMAATALPGVDRLGSAVRGERCTVRYGGEILITGTVDAFEAAYSGSTHTLSVAGRSLTKNLVDCSALPEWNGRSLTQFRGLPISDIVALLIEPFGIPLRVEGPLAQREVRRVIPYFEIAADGGSVFEAIESLIEGAFLYVADGPDGALVLAANAERPTANELVCKAGRVNVLSGTAVWDESGSYSKLIVRAQQAGDDEQFGTAVSQVMGTAVDPDVAGFRPKIITATTGLSSRDAAAAAHKEMAASLLAKFSVTYGVQGWRGDHGELWRENRLVTVDDELGVLHRQLLILSVNYTLGDQGTVCQLTLVDPRARSKPANYRVPETGDKPLTV